MAIKINDTMMKWITWLVMSVFAGAWLAYTMTGEETDKSIFMPGPLSPGHHQLEQACDACHTDAFGGGEVIQQSCVDCHGEDRVKPFDSHPAKKFKDPRNADLLSNINALQCVSCHTEHKPEITAKDGVTQPEDFCFYCHEDVAEERPSHEAMGFATCKDSGCHNYHNNRSLYTNYLIKHLHEPPTLSEVVLPEKEFISVIYEIAEYPHDSYPVQQLTAEDIDATDRLEVDPTIEKDWLETAHARSGVNCSGCHLKEVDGEERWHEHPGQEACSTCHNVEVDRFMKGKHGMKLKQGLPAMTPAEAQLPMHEDAGHEQLTCNSCHGAHRYDIQTAAVESCLQCHNDEHSNAYKQTAHYALWLKEVNGSAEPGTGVSCASCHMPRVNYDVSEWMSRTIVDHNQSANFSPNSKMIRSTCQHCHGLEFALDSLTDETLIKNNFATAPLGHIETMDLADREKKRRDEEAAEDDDASMFGF